MNRRDFLKAYVQATECNAARGAMAFLLPSCKPGPSANKDDSDANGRRRRLCPAPPVGFAREAVVGGYPSRREHIFYAVSGAGDIEGCFLRTAVISGHLPARTGHPPGFRQRFRSTRRKAPDERPLPSSATGCSRPEANIHRVRLDAQNLTFVPPWCVGEANTMPSFADAISARQHGDLSIAHSAECWAKCPPPNRAASRSPLDSTYFENSASVFGLSSFEPRVASQSWS